MIKYKVRRLPVIENKKLIGIVTATDLAKTLTHNQKGKAFIINAIARSSEPPEYGLWLGKFVCET